MSTNFFSLSLSWHCWHSSELTGSNHFLEKQEHTIMILTNNLSVSRKKCDQKSTEVSVCYISRYNLFDARMFVDIVRVSEIEVKCTFAHICMSSRLWSWHIGVGAITCPIFMSNFPSSLNSEQPLCSPHRNY